MSSGGSALLETMVDEAGEAPGNRFFADAEQLDMLRDPATGRLPPDALRQMRQQRGRGRPQGARNKRTERVAKWFIEKFGDPLEALGEIINTPTDVLYEQMVLAQGGEDKNKKLTGKDALDFRVKAIVDALPYIHGKQPISIDFNGKADAVILIPGLNAPAMPTGDLAKAVETLGIDAIERHGIRMLDGTLLEGDDLVREPDPAEGDDA